MIARKASLDFAVNFVGHALGFVGLYFVTRRMGPQALGLFAYGFAFVGIFGFLGDMGFGVAHIKRLSEGGDSAACTGTFIAVKIVLVATMCLAVVTGVWFIEYVLGRPFENPMQKTMIYLALAAVACGALADAARTTFTARTQTARRAIPQIVASVVEVAIKVGAAVAGLGALMLGWASLAGAMVLLVFSALLLHRSGPIGRPQPALIRNYAAFALPVMVIVGVNAALHNTDKLMIGWFCSGDAVGHYAAAASIVALVVIVERAVGLLLFPTISAQHGARDIEGIRSLTRRSARYLGMILLPLGVLAVLMREPITRVLLGDRFEASASVFAFLVVAAVVRTVTLPYSAQIIGTNRPGTAATLSVVLLVVNLVLNLVFIPARLGSVPLAGLGATGAGLATALTSLTMAMVYRVLAARIVPMELPRTLLRQAVAAAAMAFTLLGLRQWAGAATLPGEAAMGLASLGVYAVVLLALREIRPHDISYLLGLLSPAAMTRYILDEIGSAAPPRVAPLREGDPA